MGFVRRFRQCAARVFRIDSRKIGSRLTGEKWFSHNAREWKVLGWNAFLTDNYFAIPVLGNEKTAWIFRHSGSEWVFDQELSLEYPSGCNGYILALEGEVLVAGNGAEKSIFRRVDDAWVLEQTIRPDSQNSGCVSSGEFALGGETMAVSLSGDSTGIVELFDYERGQWVSSQRIDRQFLQLGESDDVAIAAMRENRLILISYNYAKLDNEYNGIAQIHILKREEGAWVVEQEITGESFPGVQLIGRHYTHLHEENEVSASIHGESLVVGSSAHNTVYVFRRDAEQWVSEKVIDETTFPEISLEARPCITKSSSFGYGVAVKNEMLVVTESLGPVYVFVKAGDGAWRLEASTLCDARLVGKPSITESGTVLIPNIVHALKRKAP